MQVLGDALVQSDPDKFDVAVEGSLATGITITVRRLVPVVDEATSCSGLLFIVVPSRLVGPTGRPSAFSSPPLVPSVRSGHRLCIPALS